MRSLEIDEKWMLRLQTDMEFMRNLDQAIVQSNINSLLSGLGQLRFLCSNFVFLYFNMFQVFQINRDIYILIMQEHVIESKQ